MSTLTVEDGPGYGVATFVAVQLGEDATPVMLVVDVGQQVQGLGRAESCSALHNVDYGRFVMKVISERY